MSVLGAQKFTRLPTRLLNNFVANLEYTVKKHGLNSKT